MESINGRPAVRTGLPCPQCRAAGLTDDSGYTPTLLIVQSTPVSLHCTIHGTVTPAGDGWSSHDWSRPAPGGATKPPTPESDEDEPGPGATARC